MKKRSTTPTPTEKHGLNTSEKGLLWLSGTLVGLVTAGTVIWQILNAPPPLLVPPDPPPVPVANAFDDYMAAGASVIHPREIRMAYYSVRRNKPIKEADLPPLVAENQQAFRLFQQGKGRPYTTPPDADTRFGVGASMSSLRNLSYLLYTQGRVQERQKTPGAAAAAVGSYLDTMQVGIDIPRGGAEGHWYLGTSSEAMGRDSIWHLIPRLTAAEARSAAHRLEQLETRRFPLSTSLENTKWTDGAQLVEALRNNSIATVAGLYNSSSYSSGGISKGSGVLSSFGFDPPTNGGATWISKKQVVHNYLDYMDALIARARLPYATATRLPPLAVPKDPVNLGFANLSGFSDSAVTANDLQMQSALLRAALALHAYHLEHGTYPPNLTTLTTNHYLTQPPTDPFALIPHTPLHYQPLTRDRFLLYSLGPDCQDDHGKPIDFKDEHGKQNRRVQANAHGDFVLGINAY